MGGGSASSGSMTFGEGRSYGVAGLIPGTQANQAKSEAAKED